MILFKNLRNFTRTIYVSNYLFNSRELNIKFILINKKYFTSNFSSLSDELKFVKSDLDMNLNCLKFISNSNMSLISNRKNLNEVLLNIRNNSYQFEYDIENKLNKFLHCLMELIIKSSIIQIQNLCRNENLKKIMKKILTVQNLNYYDNKSFLSILIILNLKIVENEELKFLIQYGISEELNFLKILKYGKNLLKLNFGENLMRQLFVKVSQIDNSNFPNQIIIEENLLDYLIYAKFLDKNRIDDYQFYLEKYFIKLEKELDKEDEEIKVNKKEIYKRILVLKTSIENSDLKKENPSVKLISDILLSYLRQYNDYFELDHFILFYSIISSDKFLIQYDIKLFKEKFENDLLKKLEEKFNEEKILEIKNDFVDLRFFQLVELFYYIDKLYSYDDSYFVKISGDILSELKNLSKLMKKDSNEMIEIIEIYLNNSADLINTLHLNFSEFANLENFKRFAKDLNQYEDYKNCLLEKIKNLLKFKIYFQMEKKKMNENSKFLNQLKSLKEKDELIILTKNCMELTYYIEKNLN